MYQHQHYPKVKYHPTKQPVTVNSEEQDRELGDEWAESPAEFQSDESESEQEDEKPAEDASADPKPAKRRKK